MHMSRLSPRPESSRLVGSFTYLDLKERRESACPYLHGYMLSNMTATATGGEWLGGDAMLANEGVKGKPAEQAMMDTRLARWRVAF